MVFDLIGSLGIGLSIIALVMVGRGNFTLRVGILLGTLELVSHWAPLELGADCWLLCWVTVFPLVVWPFCQN